MGLHVFPIPIPPPTSLSTRFEIQFKEYLFKKENIAQNPTI